MHKAEMRAEIKKVLKTWGAGGSGQRRPDLRDLTICGLLATDITAALTGEKEGDSNG